jgi:hypothetical protein
VTKEPPKTPEKQKAKRSQLHQNFSSPKYGWCPECRFGHRVRSRINPDGNSKFAGRWRFICSNKGNRDNGCEYFEVLDDDPLFKAQPTPSKKPRCPQCGKGHLVEKRKNPFDFKDRYLECDRKLAPERPCDYRQEIKNPNNLNKRREATVAGPSPEEELVIEGSESPPVVSPSRGPRAEAIDLTGDGPFGRPSPTAGLGEAETRAKPLEEPQADISKQKGLDQHGSDNEYGDFDSEEERQLLQMVDRIANPSPLRVLSQGLEASHIVEKSPVLPEA